MGSKLFGSVFSILFICCCGNKASINQKDADNFKMDTIIYSDSVRLFASFKEQDSYKFVVEGEGVQYSTQVLELFPIGLPVLKWYTRDWIFLQGGCGSSCFYGYLLPVSKPDTLRVYNFPLLVEKDKNIVIYCDDEALIIENFSFRRKTEFKDSLLRGPYCGYSIENIRLENRMLVFRIVNGKDTLSRKIDLAMLWQ